MLYNRLYFYTATIYQWKHLLSDFHLEEAILSSLAYLSEKGCINVYAFVIMPNHMHLLWELRKPNGKESPAASLMKYTAHKFEQRLRQFAPHVLKKFGVEDNSRRYNFWQSNPDWFWLNYIPTIEQKLHYIHYNPLQERWRLCERPVDYPYSSAQFYAIGKTTVAFLHHYNEFVESDRWNAH